MQLRRRRNDAAAATTFGVKEKRSRDSIGWVDRFEPRPSFGPVWGSFGPESAQFRQIWGVWSGIGTDLVLPGDEYKL
eukprot:5340596-Pleurochrysis_carterae.AAC.1